MYDTYAILIFCPKKLKIKKLFHICPNLTCANALIT